MFVPVPASTPFEEEFAVRVAEARGRLSRNDERVIEHLRVGLDGLAFHTADSLAQSAQVSRAAVVRFARKLGYAGFTEFRDAARGDFRERHESPLNKFAEGGQVSLLDRKVAQDTKNLSTTQALVRGEIEAAAGAIADARTVFVIGNRKSYGLALYCQRMLATVRPNVRVADAGFPDELAAMEPGDVVLACLFRRYSRLTVALVESAKEAGLTTVIVTDGRGHDFASGADHVLLALADSPTFYDSMVAPVWLLEALVAEVAAVDPVRSRKTLAAFERFIEEQGTLLE